jgi:hypothetical protein
MPDDVTQPFGGAPSLSPRYGRTPMTIEALARRIYHAEMRVMQAHGADIDGCEVVLSPEDYIDIVTADRNEPDAKGQVGYDCQTGQHTFRGHVLRMDNNLKPGDVRLRTEVFA